MFIGHWVPALAAAAFTPRAPKLGVLFIAAQLVDWAFFIFVMLGVEDMRITPGISAMNPMDLYHMPYTHSLLGTAVWSIGFAALIYVWRRDLVSAVIAATVVLSHWLLDLLVHVPDMTIAGGGERLGFGLWNYPAIEMPLELALTCGAFALYMSRTTGPRMPALLLAAVLLVLQMVNWFGPPPEAVDAAFLLTGLAAFGVAALLAWWVGETRVHNDAAGLAKAVRGR